MAELKQVVEEIGKTVQEFREKNDELSKQIEEKGSADVLLKEQVEKANTKITELEGLKERLDKIEAKGNLPGETSKKEESVIKHKSAFDSYLRKGKEEGLGDLQVKAMQIGVDADGGFAIPEELDRSILELLIEESPIRSIANVMTVSTEGYERIVNLGGTDAGWVGETDPRPETSTSQLTKISTHMGEIYANPAVTQHSLEDVMFSVESFVKNEVAKVFAEMEAESFLSGDGVNKPKGLLTYPTSADSDGTRAFGTFQEMPSLASGALSSTDAIIDLTSEVKKGYLSSSRFLLNKKSLRDIRKLKDSDGRYLWEPSVKVGAPSTIFGYGYSICPDMPNVAPGALALAFGDFKRAYTICDRIGTSVMRDPYTNKPYVHFYTRKRVGGMAVDTESVKFIKVDA